MNKKKMITVIMSTYNESELQLSESINSILNQTYNNFEFIIVNDNPKRQDLKKILLEISDIDDRVKIINNKKNIGLTRSLNLALNNAKGEYIARMDADDISRKDRFEKQVKFLNSNDDIYLVGTNCIFIDENSNELWRGANIPEKPEVVKNLIKYVNFSKHPSWMFRKELLNYINQYRDIRYVEDYDFLLRCISIDKKISNINEPLIKYRIRLNGISQENFLEQIKAEIYIKKLYKQRLLTGKDEHSLENMNENIKCTQREKEKNLLANELFKKATNNKKRKDFKFIIYFLKSSIICKYYLRRNIDLFKYKFLKKLYDYGVLK